MIKNNSLKARQICLFFIAFIPVTKLFTMPSIVARVAGADMWISSLINLLIDILTVIAILFTIRKTELDFYELLEFNFGKGGSKVILFLYLLFFMIKSFLPISEQKTYVEVTLYETVPNILYFTPFLIIAFYLAIKHIRILGRCADVMWVFTIIGYVLLFSLSISNADLTSVYPIANGGIKKILQGSYAGLNWYGDCVYLLFFIGKFKKDKRYSFKITFSFIISSLMILIFIVVFYSIFTSIAFRQRFALTETSKYTSVINSIGRFDYVGIILLLTTNVISLSLPIYFATDVCVRLFSLKRRWIPALVLVFLEFLAIRFLSEYYRSVEKFIITYGGFLFLLMGNVLPISTVFFKKGESSESISF